MGPLLAEGLQRRFGQIGPIAVSQQRQRGAHVGHVGALFQLSLRQADGLVVFDTHQVGQRHVLETTQGDLLWRRRVGLVAQVVAVDGEELVAQLVGQRLAHEFPRGVNRIDVDRRLLFGDIGFGRQRQHLRQHRLVVARFVEQAAIRLDQTHVHHLLDAVSMRRDQIVQRQHGQPLAGIPAVEAVGIMRQQKRQLFPRIGVAQLHRRRKSAQQ